MNHAAPAEPKSMNESKYLCLHIWNDLHNLTHLSLTNYAVRLLTMTPEAFAEEQLCWHESFIRRNDPDAGRFDM